MMNKRIKGALYPPLFLPISLDLARDTTLIKKTRPNEPVEKVILGTVTIFQSARIF